VSVDAVERSSCGGLESVEFSNVVAGVEPVIELLVGVAPFDVLDKLNAVEESHEDGPE